MTASAARRVAREVVTRVRERGAFAHETLASVLAAHPLDERDTAFATHLAYGTVQTRGTLDEAIDRFLDRPGSLEPRVQDALSVATHELLFTSSATRAAVHEGVELVREVRPPAAGLANAVLRRMAGDAPSFPWGDPDNDIEALARLHAHPLWLAKLLVAELGWDDAASVMAADNEAAPLYLAHNPFAGTMEEAVAALDEAGADPSGGPVPGSLVVGHPAAAVRSEPVATERVLVSDAAAQLAARLLKPAPDDVVVDIGSGRGTKTLLLQAFAVQSGGPADITAVDDDEFKARILTSRMNRHGVPRVRAVSGDARDLAGIDGVPPDGTAARVLVDAPCSGLGTLRRHPEQRWRVRPDDIGELAQLGSDLLRAAARLCASGGFMVYSTCTLTEAENEGVVRSFLESEGGREFASSSIRDEVPAEWGDFVNSNGFFQSLPSPAGPDGHFAARLQRRT